jgi:hypothetical protein
VLALLPIYVGAGRVKNHEHWQSDVLAGWAIGGAAGWHANRRSVPLTIEMLPKGVAIGVRKRFQYLRRSRLGRSAFSLQELSVGSQRRFRKEDLNAIETWPGGGCCFM